MAETTSVDVLDREYIACPYPILAHLRARDPVSRGRIPDGRPAWFVTRYDDVRMVLGDDRRFSTQWLAGRDIGQADVSPRAAAVLSLFTDPLSRDGAEHKRLRAPVGRAFTARLVESLRPFVEQRAEELLDAVERRATATGERSIELIAEYAFPIAVDTLLELLGVPVEQRGYMQAWSDEMATFDGSLENAERLWPTIDEFTRYMQSLIEDKRANPGHDLLTGIVSHGELTEDEVTKLVFVTMHAGHGTTVNLIGNGTLALLTHPDELELVASDPARIRATVEELLRYDSSVSIPRPRVALEDVEISGTPVKRGDLVVAVIAGANRDGDRFADADALDVGRPNNAHLSFGRGAHACPGAPLGRLEGQIAIATLLRRMPHLALAVAPDELMWRPGGLILRGLAALPLTY